MPGVVKGHTCLVSHSTSWFKTANYCQGRFKIFRGNSNLWGIITICNMLLVKLWIIYKSICVVNWFTYVIIIINTEMLQIYCLELKIVKTVGLYKIHRGLLHKNDNVIIDIWQWQC